MCTILVIVRITYGQILDIDRLVGAISFCELGGTLWLVKGENWKMDATLNDRANISFFASPQRICFNFIVGNTYEVNSTYKQVHYYEVLVLDIPMDEIKIIYDFIPPSQFQSDFFTTLIQHFPRVS